MTPAARAARAAWLLHWRGQRRWHRYTVEGDEHLAGPAALLVGYHGRSVARDLCMFTTWVHEREGYLPHAIFHRAFAESPLLRPLLEGVGGVVGDDGSLAAALARGEHLLVTPGGTREGCRSARTRYTLAWGRRTGYLRLALKHGLDVIPVVAAGTDDTYFGLNDGHAWGKRQRVPLGLPAWVGLGPLGPWPLSPPFPVRIRQVIGPRIRLEGTDAEALHARVTGVVQGMLDAVRS
ncbi:MAG: acyltransferase [bacterium]